MPKSKIRKGARSYRGKGVGIYGIPDPAKVFWDLGNGTLSGIAAEVAARHLLKGMSKETRGDMAMKATFGAEWPPHTTTDLISLAHRAWTLKQQEDVSLADETAS